MKHSLFLATAIIFWGACATPAAPPPAPPTPTPPAAEPAADGQALYERVCVTCHGPRGDGQGLEQQLFSFAAPESDWKNGASVDGVLVTLADGIHETSMQPFPEFGEVERRAIAAHVLSLRATLLAESR